MSRSKPNLFLIGAMKSGTTYLRKLLNAHAAIFMCEPDEPSYFVEPQQLKAIWPDMWARNLWRSEENYLALFGSAGDATILGEASTNYAKRPLVTGVAERISAFNPDARIVYLLRDPVERTLSHYWHMVRYHAEGRPIAEAIRQDHQYIAVSNYAMQANPFLQRFGRDNLAVLTHETLVRNPEGVMQGLYDWLGVGSDRVDTAGFAEPEHVTPQVVAVSRWGGLPRRVWQSAPVRSIARHVPPLIQTRLRRATIVNRNRQSVDVEGAIAYLRPIQRQQTDELMRLLGREFPEWTTLNAVRPAADAMIAGSSGLAV
jgi:hypothetical protein